MSAPHHTAEHWAQQARSIRDFIVTEVEDCGDCLALGAGCWGFIRTKSDLGRDICLGERLQLETIGISQITGLRDVNGWLFHLTDQDLADEACRCSENIERCQIEEFERDRKRYAEFESALPDWLQARIRRFRVAAGEKFLLEGWGYELMICRLADLLDRGLESAANQLAADEGASGNQWCCAKALADGRAQHGEEFAARFPAGFSPITGSTGYSSGRPRHR